MARWGMATCLAGLGNLPSVVAVGVEPRQGRAGWRWRKGLDARWDGIVVMDFYFVWVLGGCTTTSASRVLGNVRSVCHRWKCRRLGPASACLMCLGNEARWARKLLSASTVDCLRVEWGSSYIGECVEVYWASTFPLCGWLCDQPRGLSDQEEMDTSPSSGGTPAFAAFPIALGAQRAGVAPAALAAPTYACFSVNILAAIICL
ncbi:hypothetical protein BJ912DRAFT_1040104, partial [Pholiota molesta]